MSKNIRIKPGKTQSKVGVVIGLVFCFIGLFFVIPTFGSFGVLWTVIAFIIAVMNALNAFTKNGVPSHEIVIDDGNTSIGEESTKERLKKLKEVYEDELITSEEYEIKKKEILDKL